MEIDIALLFMPESDIALFIEREKNIFAVEIRILLRRLE